MDLLSFSIDLYTIILLIGVVVGTIIAITIIYLKFFKNSMNNLSGNRLMSDSHTNLELLKTLMKDQSKLQDVEIENLKIQIAKQGRDHLEDLHKSIDDLKKNVEQKIMNDTADYLNEKSISRSEFELYEKRLSKLAGPNEIIERIRVLSTLFDPSTTRVLTWQCKLIKMLVDGVAPDVYEKQMALENIPQKKCDEFLKKLVEEQVVRKADIPAYYLSNKFDWIHSYIDNPDWLQHRLNNIDWLENKSDNIKKKEKEYQEYIRNNLYLVEEGLLLEKSEYKLETGPIDFMCKDKDGVAVGLELKYPVAQTPDKRQIAGYRNDYEKKTGGNHHRFILVAPKIPDKLKTLLEDDGFEYREIAF